MPQKSMTSPARFLPDGNSDCTNTIEEVQITVQSPANKEVMTKWRNKTRAKINSTTTHTYVVIYDSLYLKIFGPFYLNYLPTRYKG